MQSRRSTKSRDLLKEQKCDFGYRTLLGEMMYAYVTYCPDTTPTLLHYQYLKHVAKYLRATKHWSIRYKRSKLREDLPPPEFDSIPPVENAANALPEFPVNIHKTELLYFVDAA